MSQTITKEAPPRGGASNGDAEAYNRPGHRVQGELDRASVPDRPTKAQLTRHNKFVVSWADQFDRKYHKFCKTLGFLTDIQTSEAHFRVKVFRQRYKDRWHEDISRETVFRRLRELEDAKVIKRTRQFRDDGSQRSSKYAVNFAYVIQGGKSVYVGPPEDADDSRATAVVKPEPDPAKWICSWCCKWTTGPCRPYNRCEACEAGGEIDTPYGLGCLRVFPVR